MAYDVARFYPRLTSAARRTDLFLDLDERIVSIRASLQQRGELSRRIFRRSDARRFNPRLTSAARRTRYVAVLNRRPTGVSTRASLQQRGERRRAMSSLSISAFQSAPHFSSEANAIGCERFGRNRMFQSAPHFSSEANHTASRSRDASSLVSIRASLQQRGERAVKLEAGNGNDCFNPRLTSAARRTPGVTVLRATSAAFQSAPHFSSEANALSKTSRSKRYSFQSAPHFSSEANVQMVLIFLQRGVSIRASLQQRGELDLPCICELPPEVSIRASLQQRGERSCSPPPPSPIEFQSAPHFSSEANRRPSIARRSPMAFQSAPHFSSEANAMTADKEAQCRSFNPRLTSAARRT